MGGPRLPMELMLDIMDHLTKGAEALDESVDALNRDCRCLTPSAASRKDCLKAVLNLTSVDKQMRRLFWERVMPRFIVPDDVLRLETFYGGVITAVPIPSSITDKFR